MRDLEKPILVLLTLLASAFGISDMNYGEQSDCLVPTSRMSAVNTVNTVNTVQNPTRPPQAAVASEPWREASGDGQDRAHREGRIDDCRVMIVDF